MRQRDEQKHEAIYEAAIDLIITNGLPATSMSKIASAANVSPSTIYIYFENKEDMLNKIYLMVKKHESEALQEGIEDGDSIEYRFRKLWFNYYQYSIENPKWFLFGEQFFNSPLVEGVKEEGLSFFEPIFAFRDEGIQEGVFKDIPLDVFVAVGFFPLRSLVKGSIRDSFELSKETLEDLYEIAWQSVAK